MVRLCASNVGGVGSIPGQGNKIPHAAWRGQKIFRGKRIKRAWILPIRRQDRHTYDEIK